MATPNPSNPSPDPASTTTTPHAQILHPLSQELRTRHHLPASTAWLTTFLSTVRHPPPPLPALASTAHFRLLHSDFTHSLSPTTQVLPPTIASVAVQHTTIPADVPVQVLDILDVGASRLAQVEMIERVERGEEVRGREVIRHVPGMDEEGEAGRGTAGQVTVKKSAGPHRLLLQDAGGRKVWGFEVVALPKVWVTVGAEEGGLQIGAKLLLRRGVVVRRGLVMLEPAGVVVMGGKVEEWDRKWRETRKQRLVDEVKRESEQSGAGE